MTDRILVVEDSPTQAEALCALLEENGYAVDHAATGEQARAYVEHGPYALVLTDVVMPGMSGYDLCRHVKQLARDPELPVVLVTSLTDPLDIVRGLECGADNYVTKPYDAEHLLARVRQVLDRPKLRRQVRASMGVNVAFLGTTFSITADKEQILDLFISSVEDVVRTNHALRQSQRELARAQRQLEAFASRMAYQARVSSEKYATLMEHAHDGILVLDAGGAVVEANVRALAILGRDLDAVRGRPLEEFVDAAQRPELRARVARLATGAQAAVRELWLVDAAGRRTCCDLAASRSQIGDDTLLLVVLHDVTARRQAEDALRDSEARYRSLFDASPLPTFAYDPATLRFLAVNEAAVRHYGYSREEFLTRTLRDIKFPEDVPALMRTVRHANGQSGSTTFTGLRHRTRDGRAIDVELTNCPLAFGDQPARIAIVSDVTERNRRDAALARNTERLQLALDAAQMGTWEWNVRTGELLWSAGESLALGPSAGGERWSLAAFLALVDAEDRGRVTATLRAMAGGTTTHEVELRTSEADREPRWLQLRGRGVPDDGGGVTRVVGVVVDVTHQRRLETQLQQAQRMEAVGQLAGGVAHDFNNLLSAIISYSDLLVAELPPTSDARADAQEIRKAADRAARLTRQLLAFGRKQVLQPRVLDLNATVTNIEAMLRRLIPETIELRTQLSAGECTVLADPGQVEQVLVNLAVNARDAMAERGGTLTVRTAYRSRRDADMRGDAHPDVPPGNYVTLTVSDTGTGIPPAIRARIFEPFFTTKEPGRGTGLGLAMVYGIVQQSGGHITMDSEVGLGTTFTIYLPCAGRPADEEAAPTERPDVARGTETIMLVEDDPDVRAAAQRILRRAGYAVLDARDGAEALRLVARAGDEGDGLLPDLVLSDVVMPGMTGPDLAQALRAAGHRLPILLMSGYTRDGVAGPGVHAQDVGYLEKPFTPEVLTRRVREMLDGAARAVR